MHAPMRLVLSLASSLLVSCVLGVPDCQAQEDSVPRTALTSGAPKSGAAATLIAVLVPGGGHIYAGEPKRGLLFLASMSATYMVALAHSTCRVDYNDGQCDSDKTLASVASFATLGVYVFSLWDAHRAAARTNRRRGVAVGHFEAMPQASLAVSARAEVRVGFQLVRAVTR